MVTEHVLHALHFDHPGMTVPKGRSRPPAGKQAQKVGSLPLVVRQSQWVRFADRYFFLKGEGLYQFYDCGKVRRTSPTNQGTIVSTDKSYSCVVLFRKDVLSFLTAISLIQTKGFVHKDLPFEKKLCQAKKGSISMNCGAASDFCSRILEAQGWTVRRVAGMRGLERRYNDFDNGHQLLEFYWPACRKWVLVDVDQQYLFKQKGEYLSLGELWHLIRHGQDFVLESLPEHIGRSMDTTDMVAGQGSFSVPQSYLCMPSDRKKDWYRQILAVPYIFAEGGVCFCYKNDADKAHVLRNTKGYRHLPIEAWYKRFYGK